MKILWKVVDMRHGWRGFCAVWREEWHFKYQAIVVVLGNGFAYVVGARGLELLLLVSTTLIALSSELINTAIEDICNKITLEHDSEIGKIKDMAQAFVIVASLPSVIVFAAVLWNHLA